MSLTTCYKKNLQLSLGRVLCKSQDPCCLPMCGHGHLFWTKRPNLADLRHHSTLTSRDKGVESSSSWLWLPPSPSPTPPPPRPLLSWYEHVLFSIKIMKFTLLSLIVLQSMCVYMCVMSIALLK